jgi:hypothetical protein
LPIVTKTPVCRLPLPLSLPLARVLLRHWGVCGETAREKKKSARATAGRLVVNAWQKKRWGTIGEAAAQKPKPKR